MCLESRNLPPKTLLHPWKYPKSPWSRLHVDYAGPFFARMYLIAVDAFPKWVDVAITHTASSEDTKEGLHHLCHSWGPRYSTIVSDSGFVSLVNNLQHFVPEPTLIMKCPMYLGR